MENHTVMQLKAIAKDRGVRVYYKLRKVKLIHALEAARLVEQKSHIFDESIPNDPTPVLQPTPWRPSNVTPIPKVVDKLLESFKNKIKKMYEKRDTLFQQTQSKSALESFAIQNEIKGLNGYDPESFLLKSEQPITKFMINTQQTKVKLILSYMMKKVDLKVEKL